MAALGLDAREARLEVQLLLQHALGASRAMLLAYPERALTVEQDAVYQGLLARRLQGEPVAYLFGEREFYGLNLAVTPATLIPRPETELLVELALERLRGRAAPRVLDLGTGSGAIALALAHSRPDAAVTACDASADALAVAQRNAVRLGLANVGFVQSDWFAALGEQPYDLIASNPPYIVDHDPHLQQGDVRFEPRTALASGPDGLDDIRRIVAAAPARLDPGGWLLLEHGYDQAPAVRALLETAGFAEVFSACDLAGIERVSGGRKPAD
ncbi:MAG: peptide chain release factor N(5)-glutamine methyltransferase [Pseudomonadota bacterium]